MQLRVLFALYLFLPINANAQDLTADVVTGCSPLTVNFSTSNTVDCFWEFGDGSSAQICSPSHVFSNNSNDSIVYSIEYRETLTGEILESINITILPNIKPTIVAVTPTTGCINTIFTVKDSTTFPPGIEPIKYSWTFGDGAGATGSMPSNKYSVPGTFDLSLEITTNIPSCNITDTFPDFCTFSKAPQVSAFTNPGYPIRACEPPLDVRFINSSDSAHLKMFWKFGNGVTSTKYHPEIQTYLESGIIPYRLTATDTNNCSSTSNQSISIFKPLAKAIYPDSVCLDLEYLILDSSLGGWSSWDFGSAKFIDTVDTYNQKVKFLIDFSGCHMSVSSPEGGRGETLP